MQPIGVWGGGASPGFTSAELLAAVHRIRESVHIVRDEGSGRLGAAFGGAISTLAGAPDAWPLIATLPSLYPEWLGDRSFTEQHRLRFPYVTGAMANGIASTELVIAMARAGFLGFFGAAGLAPDRVERAVIELDRELGDRHPWGVNLIHSPNEPSIEDGVAELLVRRGVVRVEASAFMALTPAVVRYAYAGLAPDPAGGVRRRNHVFAKISRPEVARRFLLPAPTELLDALVAQGKLTAAERDLARRLPVAEDITVEADSGGHTDNRPMTALLPTIQSLRDEIVAREGYARPVRVGVGGGIGTPGAVAAAFSLGAAYVLTGSVNQAAVESGLAPDGKEMLALADIADVTMAPAADMFELGVEVQVLKRGTMFAARARRLYELYQAHASLDAIPAAERTRVEKEILRGTFEDAWRATRDFWAMRGPAEIDRAERDPRHKMALVFRAYLGLASKWAIAGNADRRLDYQIWCGPAMGAFNAWTAGTFLAEPANRSVVQVARNLMEGAAVVTRAQQLRSFGLPIPAAAFDYRPRPLR